MVKHVVSIAVTETVIVALYGVTWLTGPHLAGTRSLVTWTLAGFTLGYFGSPFVRRWYEETHRERADS